MSESGAGKGDSPRPCLISREEKDLRQAYAWGELNIGVEEMKRRLRRLRKKYGLKR